MCECEAVALLDLQMKYEDLQIAWDDQREHVGRLQKEIFSTRTQLMRQGKFSVTLGAVLATLLWKTSMDPTVVEVIVQSTGNMENFLDMADCTLQAFLDTYEDEAPPSGSDDSRFMEAVCGTIANMAACNQGRALLESRASWIVSSLASTLARLPSPSADELKKLILAALYNIGISKEGQALLQASRSDLLPQLRCGSATTPELRLMCLRMLQAMTFELPTHAALCDFLEQAPIDFLESIATGAESQQQQQAQLILDNLERGIIKFRGMIPGGRCLRRVPYGRCFYVHAGSKL